MNTYITGATIKRLREAKGLPDITLIEPLSKTLGVSVAELMSGDTVNNQNHSANILRSKFHVCPLCGNAIHSTGNAMISCCGITLPALDAEDADGEHEINIEKVEDEYFITINHEMRKTHFISYIAHITSNKSEFIKLYPEGNAESRLQLRGRGYLYIFCNKHGLMKKKL